GSAYIGGGEGFSNKYLIDGVDNNDPSFQTPTITLSIDAIAGIRLLSKNYPAEFGGSASQVNIATKSGTNKYHGTLYDFLQNDALNATNYFSRPDPISGRIKPVVRYNQFGGSLGGPLTIPKLINGQNRLFFFVNYEGTRSHSVVNQQGRFPTIAELQGDFSGDPTIYDPATGLPFPGNKIPTIDAKAAQIIALNVFPTPNVPPQPGFNTVKALNVPDNIDQYTVRVDARISARDSLFVRWSASAENRIAPKIDPNGDVTYRQSGKNLAVDYTHIFSNSLVNDFKIGLNRPLTTALAAGAFGKDIAGSLFTGTDPNPATYGLTHLGFSDYTTIGATGSAPNNFTTNDPTIADNLTVIRGAHTLKLGAVLRKVYYKEVNANEPRGNIGFDGRYTSGSLNTSGNAIADFLLGDSSGGSVYQGNYSGWYNSHGWDFFAQDNWKVTPKLTVDLGLRYEYESPFQEEHDRVSMFDSTYPGGRYVTPNAAAAAEVNSPLIGVRKSRNLTEPDRNNWAPRIGFSYRAEPMTVVRGGYGVFFDTLEFNEYVLPVLNAPFQKSASVSGTIGNPVKIDGLFPIASTPTPVAGSMVGLFLDTHSVTPYSQNWNLDIERELPGDQMVEIAYIGSELTQGTHRLNYSQGILKNAGQPDASVTFPYPNFALVILSTTGASSNYNAGYVRYTKRFSKGYSILANYTFSRVMGIEQAPAFIGTVGGYPQNTWDLKADYGALPYDARHNLVISGIWELPFGKNKAFASNLPYAANLLVDGWQVSGIKIYRSGFPYLVSASDASQTHSSNARADIIGNPRTPDPVDPSRAFNRYAFAQPVLHTFGNSRTDQLRGPGLTNTDLSLFKNTYIGGNLNFQLRVDAFNVFNQAQIGPFPGNRFSLDPASSFGVYSTIQHNARNLQVGAKIIF
ncbi:MAG: TonB-dependent receptor, partial [Acidobacteriaceae bacterium]